MSTEITLTRPDDWHLHLRDGAALAAVLPATAAQFARAIVMPNLSPPCATSADVVHGFLIEGTNINTMLVPGYVSALPIRFKAPRELVWKAMVEPEHMKRWWGPDGFSIEGVVMDLRVGGAWTFVAPLINPMLNKTVA